MHAFVYLCCDDFVKLLNFVVNSSYYALGLLYGFFWIGFCGGDLCHGFLGSIEFL